MAKKTRNRRTQRSIAMHTALEPRKMLAGDVGVAIQDGLVTFTGTNSAESIQVVQDGDSVTISGADGTTINGASGPFVVQSGAQNLSYRGSLRGGDDAIAISGLDTSGSVRFFGGRGDDTIRVDNSQIGANLSLLGGRGNDEIALSNVNVDRSQLINGGGGEDTLTLAGDNTAQRDRLFSIESSVLVEDVPVDDLPPLEETPADNGPVVAVDPSIVGLSVDGGNVTISGTSGDDGIIIQGVPGGVRVTLSRISGSVFEDGTTSRIIDLGPDSLESLTLDLGDGNDGVFISGIDTDALNVNGGRGGDQITTRNSRIGVTNFTDLEVVR